MFESFFSSLVDGRTLHTDYPRRVEPANDDPLALAVAVQTYKVIEKIAEFASRLRHPANDQHRAVGCG